MAYLTWPYGGCPRLIHPYPPSPLPCPPLQVPAGRPHAPQRLGGHHRLAPPSGEEGRGPSFRWGGRRGGSPLTLRCLILFPLSPGRPPSAKQAWPSTPAPFPFSVPHRYSPLNPPPPLPTQREAGVTVDPARFSALCVHSMTWGRRQQAPQDNGGWWEEGRGDGGGGGDY